MKVYTYVHVCVHTCCCGKVTFLLLPQVVGLLDVFTPAPSYEDFQDVYLVTHLMGADLTNIIRQQALSDDHVKFLVYQILRGLKVREGCHV